jgi:pimeloyl-ACP methyl ester carboxylesterase
VKNITNPIIVLAAFNILSFDLVAQTNKDQPDNIKDTFAVVDGHKMHYQTGGTGSATVVFESGAGTDLSTWDAVFTDVALFAKVVRYDRNGLGSSEAAMEVPSYEQVAATLHTLLQQANIYPPYILVGHSFGGAIIRAFAYLYKNEVTGMVMIDPFNEFQFNHQTKEEILADAPKDTVPGTAWSKEVNFLVKEAFSGLPILSSYNPLPDIPMTLLVAGSSHRPPYWTDNLIDFYKEKMDTLSDARLIVVNGSNHDIHDYDPQLVIECIKRVVFPDPQIELKKILHDKGVDSCIVKYKKIKAAYPEYLMRESILNNFGYDELNSGHMQEAIKLFALNVEFYPESWNVYDSLGEAYMDAGDKTEAIKNYEKSLAMNPGNTNAATMLKKLKGN